MTALQRFMQAATAVQQEALATRAGTSRSYLYQLAAGDRRASAELAADIEKASRTVARSQRPPLPIVLREELCPACAACDLRKSR